MDKKYIDVAVATYALPSVLLALSNNGVNEMCITKQDNSLYIRIEQEVLENAVYHIQHQMMGEVSDSKDIKKGK
jgi:hypothetical protein